MKGLRRQRYTKRGIGGIGDGFTLHGRNVTGP
jgi:hypothetical protein